MAKKIAVLTRDRQPEALRMALGIILMDDIVDVYILDRQLEGSEDITMNIEMMGDMEMQLFTNCSENSNLDYLTTEEIAHKLYSYDHIVAY